MDYRDMVESLRRKQQAERSQPGFYDGCTKIDWELEELCRELDKNAVVVFVEPGHPAFVSRPLQSHRRPAIAEFAEIAKSMSQGSGGIVSLMS